MAPEHAREVLAHLAARLADGDGAGNVCRAVGVLRAAIEQIKGTRFEHLLAFRTRAVMHDRAVRSGTGDRREAEVAEVFAFLAKGFESVARRDLLELAQRRGARQPG